MDKSDSNNSISRSLSTSSIDISENITSLFKDFKLKSSEELGSLLQICKNLIDESAETSHQWKWLIRKSIEMRYRLANIMSDSIEDEFDNTSVASHIFKPSSSQIPSKRLFCDHCTNTIWIFQKSYTCTECSFNVHAKCLKFVTRVCAAVIVAEKGMPELRICPEIGLYFQLYRCAECNMQLMNREYNFEPRLCHYTGLYFCKNCHWNENSIIPANIVHNWDFQQKSVCRQSHQEISLFYEKPVINLEEINPKLFIFVQKLRAAKEKRMMLMEMKKYLDVCRVALSTKLINNVVGNRRYIVENAHMFSVYDLVCMENSSLIDFLKTLIAGFRSHIQSCLICQGHGFICEHCNNKEPIYPFDDGTFKCERCNACYHRSCMTLNIQKGCPKCERLLQKRRSQESSFEEK